MSSSRLDTLPVPPANPTRTPYPLGVVGNYHDADHHNDEVGDTSSADEIGISVENADQNDAGVDDLEALAKQEEEMEEQLNQVRGLIRSASQSSLPRMSDGAGMSRSDPPIPTGSNNIEEHELSVILNPTTPAGNNNIEEHSTTIIVSQPPTPPAGLSSSSVLRKGSERTKHVHPDGWVYYVYPDEHIVTAEDLAPALYVHTNGECHFSTEELAPGDLLPADVQTIPAFSLHPDMEVLVSNLHGPIKITYINHEFHYASDSTRKVLVPNVDLNAVYKLRSKYWDFVREFPSHRLIPDASEHIARRALVWYLTEGVVRGMETNAPFMPEECRHLFSCLDVHAKTDIPASNPHLVSSAKNFLIAWIMFNVAEHKYRNSFGLKPKPTPPNPSNTHFFFKCCSIICFGAPTTHWGHIVRSSERAKQHGDTQIWPTYINALVRDWKSFNIAATILLSASVGFLAIPEITVTTQATALLSLVLTLGSVMIGVFLTWRHQVGKFKLEYNISDINLSQSYLLAVILSLPFMLLMWGVISFLVTVIIFSFEGSTQRAGPDSVPLHRWVSWVVLGLSLTVASTAAFSIFRVRMLRVPKLSHKAPLLPY